MKVEAEGLQRERWSESQDAAHFTAGAPTALLWQKTVPD